MKPKLIFSTFPLLLVLLMLAGSQNASAADVHFGVGIGDHHHYWGDHRYRTYDNAYDTWYSDTPVYSYDNTYPTYSTYSTYDTTPYVYASPSVEFNSWYGDGYRNRGSVYSGGRGYSGGFRGGRSSGGGGGHGGHR